MTLIQSLNSAISLDHPTGAYEVQVKTNVAGGQAKATVSSNATWNRDHPARHVAVGQAQAIRKALKLNQVNAVTRPDRQDVSAPQWGKTASGHAGYMLFTPHANLVIPSMDKPYGPEAAPSALRRFGRALASVLPRMREPRLTQTPGQASKSPGLDHVPHEALTRQAHDRGGQIFEVARGELMRFDPTAAKFVPADPNADPAAPPYEQVRTLGDGNAYAVRGSEVLRLDPPVDTGGPPVRLKQMFQGDTPIAAISTAPSGDLYVLDVQGRLSTPGGELSGASIELLGDAGAAQPGVRATAMIETQEHALFFAGSDGKLYRSIEPVLDGKQIVGVRATEVKASFGGGRVIDLAQTRDATGQTVMHAIVQAKDGSVFNAYHDAENGGDFKDGWRFDTTLMFTSRNGLPEPTPAAADTRNVNADGLRVGMKDGRLYTARPGSNQWRATSLDGLSAAPKVNPLGGSKLYAKVDGAVARLNLVNTDPTLPAAKGEPFFHGAARPLKVQPQALVPAPKGDSAIIDFAVMEQSSVFPGANAGTAFHIDDQGRLFRTDLAKQDTQPVVLGKTVGMQQLELDREGVLYGLAPSEKDGRMAVFVLQPIASGTASAASDASDVSNAADSVDSRDSGDSGDSGATHEWVPAPNIILPPDDRILGIESSYLGQLHLRVEDGNHQARPPYKYDRDTGLMPADSYEPRHALSKAGGKDLHVPVLPEVHVSGEVLGLRTTGNPFKRDKTRGPRTEVVGQVTQVPKSRHPGAFASAWSHISRMGNVRSQLKDFTKHQLSGWDQLKPLYDSVKAAATSVGAASLKNGTPTLPTDFATAAAALEDPAAAQKVQDFRDELMTNTHQLLHNIGQAAGFLDLNFSPDPTFKAKTKAAPDMIGDMARWFTAQWNAEATPDAKTANVIELVAGMAKAGMQMPYPQPTPKRNRDRSDLHAVAAAALVKNLDALEGLAAAMNAGGTGVSAAVDQLKATRDADPATVYSGLAMQNFTAVERSEDILLNFSKEIGDPKHPLSQVMRGGLGVRSANRRGQELVKLARGAIKDPANKPMDPVMLAKYNATDAAQLLTMLKDKTDPAHAPLKAQLRDEARTELKNRFTDAILGLNRKEILVVDRNYGLGLDPLAYIHAGGEQFVFAGGMVGRDYNFYVEVLGDDNNTGDLAFVLDKMRSVAFVVAGGAGHTTGHGRGFLDHWFRAAAFLEIGVNESSGGGPLFVVPRDKMKVFVDKLFEYSQPGAANANLPKLLEGTQEREMADHETFALEAKLQVFARAGFSGYHEDSAGAFWAARPTLFQMTIGGGYEWEEYKFRGTMLSGAPQPGFEEHSYLVQDFMIGLPGLRFRHWLNEPTPADAEHQFAMGIGNTDNELRFEVHDRSGHKRECRLSIPDPVSPDEWKHTVETFQDYLGDLGDVQKLLPADVPPISEWAALETARMDAKGRDAPDGDTSFCNRLKLLKDAVAASDCDEPEQQAALAILDKWRWQHSLALAKKPMIAGIIDEMRLTNPSDLLAVGKTRQLGEALHLLNRPGEDDWLRLLQKQIAADPTLNAQVKGLLATHPTRVKVKAGPRPDMYEKLVQRQIADPNLSRDDLKKWVKNSENMAVQTVTALRSSDVKTSMSIFPIVGIASGASLQLEESVGTLKFLYGSNSKEPVAYVVGGGINKRSNQVSQAFELPGARTDAHRQLQMKPVMLPELPQPPQRGSDGAAPSSRDTGTDRSSEDSLEKAGEKPMEPPEAVDEDRIEVLS